MAGRPVGYKHDQSARDKIKTSSLINRLQAFALSEPDPQTGNPVEMTPAQAKAAIALLKKTIPDLQVIEGSMDLHHHKHEEALVELE
jgi:hypothetical protein